MKLNVIPFSSNRFTFEDGCFISEASDLGNNHLQKLYDDSCDVGLVIRSEKTQKSVTYYLDHIEYHRLDKLTMDATSWEYRPTTESIREVPECKGTSVTVFND